MIDDLAGFVKEVENIGECKLVEKADWDIEIGSISEVFLAMPNPPLLLFDSIKDYPKGYRVVTGAFATPRRILLALDPEQKDENLVAYFRKRLKEGIKPLPPVQVDDGCIKENIQVGGDVDVFRFPAPKWHSLDGGRYIGTGSVVITRDPEEGWVNFGTFRVQIHTGDTATVYVSPGKQTDIIRRKYWAKGQPCPAVVVCGEEPVLYYVAALQFPWGDSEYDMAGWLKKRPIEVTQGVTTDILIPATAEIALEGEIMPPEVERIEEGPFGEWTGYYASGAKLEPTFRIKAILHRNNPIILGTPPLMNFGSAYAVTLAQRLAILWDELDNIVPGIVGVGALEGARGLYMPVIAIRQMYPGHAKHTAMAAAASRILAYHYGRFIIVVDDDIDPTNTSEVLWAVATRCDPLDSIDIVRGCWSTSLDPTLSPEKKAQGDLTNNKAIINACKPYRWKDKYPVSYKLNFEEVKKIKDKWRHLLWES